MKIIWGCVLSSASPIIDKTVDSVYYRTISLNIVSSVPLAFTLMRLGSSMTNVKLTAELTKFSKPATNKTNKVVIFS